MVKTKRINGSKVVCDSRPWPWTSVFVYDFENYLTVIRYYRTAYGARMAAQNYANRIKARKG